MNSNTRSLDKLKDRLTTLESALAETSYWKATEVIQLELEKMTIMNRIYKLKTRFKVRQSE